MSLMPADAAAALLADRHDSVITPPVNELQMNSAMMFVRPGTSRDMYPASSEAVVGNFLRAPAIDRRRDTGAKTRRKDLIVRPGIGEHPLCKKLFGSAECAQQNQYTNNMECVQGLINRIQLNHDIDIARRAMERESHEERLKDLRNLEKICDKENWMYQSVEELLGFT